MKGNNLVISELGYSKALILDLPQKLWHYLSRLLCPFLFRRSPWLRVVKLFCFVMDNNNKWKIKDGVKLLDINAGGKRWDAD